MRRDKNAPETIGEIGIIGGVSSILGERNRVRNFIRPIVDADCKPGVGKHGQKPIIEICDGHRSELKLPGLSPAGPQPQQMIDEIEFDLEAVIPGMGQRWRPGRVR